MRLLLDAHISAAAVGSALQEKGHDVRSVAAERGLDGAGDELLLELAGADGRITVTFDVKDFLPLLRRWAESGRSHAGCLILVGVDHAEFGRIIRGIDRALDERPDHGDWVDYVRFISRRR